MLKLSRNSFALVHVLRPQAYQRGGRPHLLRLRLFLFQPVIMQTIHCKLITNYFRIKVLFFNRFFFFFVIPDSLAVWLLILISEDDPTISTHSIKESFHHFTFSDLEQNINTVDAKPAKAMCLLSHHKCLTMCSSDPCTYSHMQQASDGLVVP